METYRTVIVGLTGIGARRPPEPTDVPLYGAMPASHAASYYRHPQTEVTAVCDIRQELQDEFRNNWADVWPQVRCYTDYREMLEKERPDLVSIATSDHFHADITVAAAESSARGILCEKPIATTLADADRMIAAAEKNDVVLSVEHTRRWNAEHHAAREFIRGGEVGPLRTVVANLLSPRAMLFRNGTHTIDTICFFAESDPVWVSAELEEGFDDFTAHNSEGGRDPGSDPAASAYIRFANGVRAFYNGVKTQMLGSQLELQCDEGRIEVSDRGALLVQSHSHIVWGRRELRAGRYMYTQQLGAVAELVDAVENGRELVSPAREARKTLQIILAILKSHEAGNTRIDLS